MANFISMFLIIILIDIYTTSNYLNDVPPKREDYPGITCGKPNPQEPKDCYKYGTDSGMYCCWISGGEYDLSEGECQLLSHKMADKKNITGPTTFTQPGENKKFWSCGNKSYYLNINFKSYILFLFCIINYYNLLL